MAALTEEYLNKLSKTDVVALAVNLQDKMEVMKSNLNEKVSSVTEEVQKLISAQLGLKKKSFNERLIALEAVLGKFPVLKTGMSEKYWHSLYSK